MSKLEELKVEADEAGVTYSVNIGEAGLQKKLEAFYDKDVTPVVEVITETEVVSHAELIKAMERENKKTRVVKLTMVDKREASTATDAYFSSGTVSMRVPLDTFVEMPVLLIERAKSAKALIHKKVADDRFSVPSFAPKYVVEFK